MRTRTVLATIAVSALAVVVSACSDDGGGPGGLTPLPQSSNVPQESVSATPGLPHSGAPKVPSPIADTAQWESDPCKLLTADQFSELGLAVLEPQREDAADLGPGCLWEADSDKYIAISDGLATVQREGLSTAYKNNQAGEIKYFEELPSIEGHPAVIAEIEDLRSEGECGVAVGLRDDLSMTVAVQADTGTKQGKDPCGWAVKVATAAVKTMKGSA